MRQTLLQALVKSWPFWPSTRPWLSHSLSAALVLLLVLSRFLLLPVGPWEQDEALLACGVLDFDPGHHMPHPPGFPLWVWLGRLLMALGVGDPARALQLASATASVLTFPALVLLWEPLLGRRQAVAAALLALFLPGSWFHASRAFTETAAAWALICALVVWQRGERAFMPAALLLCTSALLRPPWLPFLLVVGLVWAWSVRQRPGELLRVAGLALLLAGALVAPLVLEAGGLDAYWQALLQHGREHAFLLGTEGYRWAELGLVKGLGGRVPAALVLALAVAGWVSWVRALGWRRWLAATGLALWFAYLLLFTHNSTYPRYAVLALLLLPGPAVWALGQLVRKPPLVLGITCLATLLFGLWTYPAVLFVHRHPLPAVAAFLSVPENAGATVVFQDELFSFRNYLVRTRRLKAATLRWSEVQAPKFALGGARLFLVTETSPAFLPASTAKEQEFVVGEERVVRLSQGRFLQARLVHHPVLMYQGGSVREQDAQGRPFVWLYPDATLLLPALQGPGGLTLAVELPPGVAEEGGTQVQAWVDGQEVAVLALSSRRGLVRVPLPELGRRKQAAQVVPLRLRTQRWKRLAGDLRPLALKVHFVSLEAPPWPARTYAFSPEAEQMHGLAVHSEGVYGPERFADAPGAWCQPRCSFELAVSTGRLQVWLSAPRPGGAMAALELAGTRIGLWVAPTGTYVELPVTWTEGSARRAVLVLTADPFRPPQDPRTLGVVVHALRFEPQLPPLPVAGPAAAFPLTR